jgi:hypothetical protein
VRRSHQCDDRVGPSRSNWWNHVKKQNLEQRLANFHGRELGPGSKREIVWGKLLEECTKLQRDRIIAELRERVSKSRALAADPNHKPKLPSIEKVKEVFDLASVLTKLGKIPQAIERYRQVIERDGRAAKVEDTHVPLPLLRDAHSSPD